MNIIYNELKYQVVCHGLDLNAIPLHPLLPLFKTRDEVIQKVVDSMVLELLLGLEGINYADWTFSTLEKSKPHHFVIRKKNCYGSSYNERLKYSEEELATLYPLDIFFAAWKKSEYQLMKGVKGSPLVQSVCACLYDMLLSEQAEGKVDTMKLISAFIGPYDTGLDWWKEGYTLSVGEKVIYRLYEWNDEWAEDTVYGAGIITDKYTDDKTICQGRQDQSGLFLDKLDEQTLSEEQIIDLFLKHEEGALA